jgi:hypothetical protein
VKKFNEHSEDKVIDLMLALYVRQQFDPKNDVAWQGLAWRAGTILDQAQAAWQKVTDLRHKQDAAYRRSEEETDLPDPVPYDKAVRFITGEGWTKRAVSKLETFVRCYPDYFFGVHGNKVKAREHGPQKDEKTVVHDNKVHMLIKRWCKHGMSREEALTLQHLFEDKWPDIIANIQSQNARKRKRRGPPHAK